MDIEEVKKIWKDSKIELRDTIPDHAYDTWIEPMEAVGFDDNIFSLLTVHQLAVELVRKNYYKQIKSALSNAFGYSVDFSINYDMDLANNYLKEKHKEMLKQKKESNSTVNKVFDNLAQMQSFSNLNLKYKFENFVVGENSRFAYATALTVAQNPAKRYNPLYIYGASGLGKTHLMQAIGHYLLFNKPKLKVRYITTEAFMNEFIDSLRKGKYYTNNSGNKEGIEKFHQRYRNLDVLLIDDVQFLESRESTTNEIFNTFEALYNSNKQIVLTSDRLPKDIPTLPDRLRTRFEMGLVVDITPPDFETRVAILKNLADLNSVKLEFSVLEYIASNFVSNVRELEGAFNKLTAFAEIENTVIDLDFAKKVLKCDSNSEKITMDTIANLVAKHFNITVEDFKSSSRNQRVSSPRHIAVYICREFLNASFEDIANYFNKKHPTMLYSYEKIKKDLKTDVELQKNVSQIKESLNK